MIGEMTAEGFERFVHLSDPGAKVVYHTGFLFEDRQRKTGSEEERDRISKLANCAYAAYLAGQVDLVQRRVSYACWDYLAIRRSRPGIILDARMPRAVRHAPGGRLKAAEP